jgi:hypothetical protein
MNSEELQRQAFERVKEELASLPSDDLVQVNVDVPSAVSRILRVLPRLRDLRSRIAADLPAFDLAAFDKLEDYALSLSYAQTCYQTAASPAGDLRALSAQAATMRRRLLADARALSVHGLIDASRLAQLKGANGYRKVAENLLLVSTLLQESWPQIQGKLATTAGDLEAARQTATRFMTVIHLREQGPGHLASATEQRIRAFTLVTRVYEQARRAVRYLSTDDREADSIAPSLYRGRPRRKSSEVGDQKRGGRNGPFR